MSVQADLHALARPVQMMLARFVRETLLCVCFLYQNRRASWLARLLHALPKPLARGVQLAGCGGPLKGPPTPPARFERSAPGEKKWCRGFRSEIWKNETRGYSPRLRSSRFSNSSTKRETAGGIFICEATPIGESRQKSLGGSDSTAKDSPKMATPQIWKSTDPTSPSGSETRSSNDPCADCLFFAANPVGPDWCAWHGRDVDGERCDEFRERNAK